MTNIAFIREYIKESINHNMLGDDIELSYADHLNKLKLIHRPSVEDILRQNLYSDNRYGGTSIYAYFNRKDVTRDKRSDFAREGLLGDLMQEGGAAIDDIFHCFPALPYTEDGAEERISDMITDKIYDGLIRDLIKLTQQRHSTYENRILGIIRKFADSITNEWALIYLKKKKVETDYTTAEDPAQQIIDNLNLESNSEQVKNLVKYYLSQYYEDLKSTPETALEDFKNNLDFYINTTDSVK